MKITIAYISTLQVPITRPVLINYTGLVFANRTYNRKSSTVMKMNSTSHIFQNNMYNRKSNAVMKMNSTIHKKLEQLYNRTSVYNRNLRVYVKKHEKIRGFEAGAHSRFGHYFCSNLHGSAPRGPRGVTISEFFFHK